jgi:hypothetical protein
MGIMVMLTVVAVTSYFGATRGAAMRGAVSHLQDTLTLARQTAIMRQRDAYIVFNTNGPCQSYVVCLAFGSGNGSGRVFSPDRYGDWSGIITNALVYNLNSGASSTITALNSNQSFTTADAIWAGRSPYGWEVNPETYLPRNFKVEDAKTHALPGTVIYKSDGTTVVGGYAMEILEDVINPAGVGKVRVEGLTGFVTGRIEAR